MIAEALIRLRKRYNLTQAELAKKLHVHPKTIKNWEAGTTSPNAENIRDIASFYHVSSDYLLGITSDESISLAMLSPSDRVHITAAIQAYIDSCIRLQNK